MFGKRELADSLNHDLAHARNKRDALAASVTTLTAKIAELEARLSAETERRDRRSSAFAADVAGLRNTTEAAETLVPEARELNELLDVIATEVAKAIDGLLCQLDLRIEAVRAGNAAQLPQPLTRSAESPQISGRVQRLREWLSHRKSTKEEAAEDRAAA